ncbi:hypothetical protein AV530_019552 [Patagioenas fasciata monilis]|uniref:Uncharacterized protein n=1 Tax=Patagioenas fasciata monilis TaxID=372326 RepID=A0A1V4JDL2_PATFA|nr:hypothetical protein AV530_019552 [Patagioenas fasciata monilis]
MEMKHSRNVSQKAEICELLREVGTFWSTTTEVDYRKCLHSSILFKISILCMYANINGARRKKKNPNSIFELLRTLSGFNHRLRDKMCIIKKYKYFQKQSKDGSRLRPPVGNFDSAATCHEFQETSRNLEDACV